MKADFIFISILSQIREVLLGRGFKLGQVQVELNGTGKET